MKTIHKLILKSYLGPMFMTFFIVMFVLLMQFMWKYIDEMVGKGLDFSVIMELLVYAAATLIPLGLPLATLLASIMTLGNLGENYELLAMKSAGMSLPKIIQPLTILIFFFSVASFFAVNNLVPYSYKKMYTILHDIRSQKQALEFQDGIFYNAIDNMSIRVGTQHKNGLLENVLIYDNRNARGDMTTTVADSGYIRLSDDKNFLLVTLFSGETYEEGRASDWMTNSTLRHHIFDRQDGVIPLEGFNMERSDESILGATSKTQTIRELSHDIDSMQQVVDQTIYTLHDKFLNSLFVYNNEMIVDSLEDNHTVSIDLRDSIASMDEKLRARAVRYAVSSANEARGYLNWDEDATKQSLERLNKYKNDWHKMLSLPVSIMIFFLIGAPLGAIIRRGGLGLPIVVSVSFFIFYYIITIFGDKLAKEGTWSAFSGSWLSTFVLFPIAAFLTYKATNDSNLFNADWYRSRFKKIQEKIISFRKK